MYHPFCRVRISDFFIIQLFWYLTLSYTDRSCGDRPPMETKVGISEPQMMPPVSDAPGYGYDS